MTKSACGPRCSAPLFRAALVVVGCLLFAAFAFGQTAAARSAGYSPPPLPAFAPGQVVTLTLYGLKGPLPAYAAASSIPLPHSLAGISLSAKQAAASPDSIPVPLFSVERLGDHTAAVTIQVPFELVVPPPSLPGREDSSTVIELAVLDNGVEGEKLQLRLREDSPYIVTSCDTSVPLQNREAYGHCTPMVTHADGSLVSISNPAHPGETLVIYAHGLGRTQPAVPSGQASPTPAANVVSATYRLMTITESGPWPVQPTLTLSGTPLFAGLTPGLVGLYQVNLTLPAISSEIPGCSASGNMMLMVGGQVPVGAAMICVQP